MLHRLVDLGNTVIVIEHNLDVIKNADWIVDLGPEAGSEGGNLVFAGTPEELVEQQKKDGRKKASDGRRQTATERGKKQGEFLSYTAQALVPVFETGEFAERNSHGSEETTPATKIDIQEFGVDAKMPWETNGLRWHTKDRVSRSGQPIHWEGRILAEVIRRIESSEKFAPINWNHRSIVAVNAEQKQLGWFLHALTAEEWLLKMKFRVPKNTFNKTTLVARLDLKPLNDMEEIPMYGTKPRVRVATKGRWQEIEIKAHSWKEINRKEFWDFLDTSIKEFAGFVTEKLKPNDLMPWRVLGEQWHRLPRGLIGGNKLRWDISLLTELFGMIGKIAGDLRVVWTNKVLVPFHRPKSRSRSFVYDAPALGRTIPDIVVHTKRVDAVYVDVYVSKNTVPLGRIRNIGSEPLVNGENTAFDILQFKFTEKKELKSKEFQKLLLEALGE